jgi:hypothetical protein
MKATTAQTDNKTARIETRISPDDLAAIRDAYALTYPKHRLSFSAWVAATLMKAAACATAAK